MIRLSEISDHEVAKALRAEAFSTMNAKAQKRVRDTLIAILLDYARDGVGAQEGQAVPLVTDRLDDVMRALFCLPGVAFDVMKHRFTPTRDPAVATIWTVLLATRGRIRLSRTNTIEVGELAALAGLDPSSVRKLAKAAELHRVAGPRSPLRGTEARKLLAARHVAPYATEPTS